MPQGACAPSQRLSLQTPAHGHWPHMRCAIRTPHREYCLKWQAAHSAVTQRPFRLLLDGMKRGPASDPWEPSFIGWFRLCE